MILELRLLNIGLGTWNLKPETINFELLKGKKHEKITT